MPIVRLWMGPSGGTGGTQSPDDPVVVQIPDDAVLQGLQLSFSTIIEQISLDYVQGSPPTSSEVTFGGSSSGSSTHSITLNQGEVVTSLHGTYEGTVNTLGVVTNLTTYGPWGTDIGPFTYRYDIPATCRLVGLWGFTGDHIDRFGVVIESPSVE